MSTEVLLYGDDGRMQSFVISGDQQWYEFAHPVQVKRFQVRFVPDPQPEPEPSANPEFLAHVLAWLRHPRIGRAPGAVAVESVSGYGTDWSGDTEGGFYSAFEVEILWRDAAGGTHVMDVEGAAAQSLWEWVVGNWPAPIEVAE